MIYLILLYITMYTDNAFIIVHFGDKKKYLELEIYLSLMIRRNSTNDIVYFYSINDTPIAFVNIMKKYCNYTISYDDKNITYNISKFKSSYLQFNTLRTCNFLFAYTLTQYKKICLIESDCIILKNIDDIFLLKSPSILLYTDNKNNIITNNKYVLNHENILDKCISESKTNGGVMLFKPSLKKYHKAIRKIQYVIDKNCIFPNETLFLIINKFIYNLPFKYNIKNSAIHKYYKFFNVDHTFISIVHFNSSQFKYIDLIRNNYMHSIKSELLSIVLSFKKKYYDKYNKSISYLLSNL